MEIGDLLQIFDSQLQEAGGKFPPRNYKAYGIDEDDLTGPATQLDIRIPKQPLADGNTDVVYNPSYKERKKQLKDMIMGLACTSSAWQVFSDWIAFTAMFVSNLYDAVHEEERLEGLKDLCKRYGDMKCQQFLAMVLILFKLFDEALERKELRDFLGEIYEDLNLTSEENGQYFTPRTISRFMGEILLTDTLKGFIEEKGYVTIMEPAAGSGRMLLSIMEAVEQQNYNHKTQCVVLAVDRDIRCVHMAYIQLAMYGVPAVVVHGDSLALQEWSRWYTPVYLIDSWIWRVRLSLIDSWNLDDERIKCHEHPMYGIMRYGFPKPKERQREAGLLHQQSQKS